MTKSTRTTTIFTKEPEPGRVKTRLEPVLGSAGAAELALSMLDDTVSKCTGADRFETVLCVTPLPALAWFRERYASVTRITPQIGADLGERLARHFESELASGGRTLVALGSDAPHTPVEAVLEAHERLEAGAEVVLGLDDGGGYYSIGLRRAVPALFRSVAMSTPDMGERTVSLARSLGLRVEFVAAGFDIDEPADLDRLRRLLATEPGLARRIPRTAATLVISPRS